jgi:hypothetical protein
MKPSERAAAKHDHRPNLVRALGCILALAGMATAIPSAAFADTVLTYNLNSSSDLAGSGASPSAFCTAGTNCPGTSPAFELTQNAPLSGTISIDVTNSTMSFDLTLTQNASFGNGLTLNAGSSFVASTATPVSVGISSSTQIRSHHGYHPGRIDFDCARHAVALFRLQPDRETRNRLGCQLFGHRWRSGNLRFPDRYAGERNRCAANNQWHSGLRWGDVDQRRYDAGTAPFEHLAPARCRRRLTFQASTRSDCPRLTHQYAAQHNSPGQLE